MKQHDEICVDDDVRREPASSDRRPLAGMVEHRRGVYEVKRSSSVFSIGEDDEDEDEEDEEDCERVELESVKR